MRAAFLALIRSITPLERLAISVVMLLVIVVTALPPAFGWLAAERSGKTWIGRQTLSVPDFAVYLSAIDQAKSGAVLTENLFTTESTPPTFNALWYSVGRFADAFSLTPTQAFHAARLLLIPPLAAVSYLAIAFFLADRRQRLAAFALYMFGSGLGAYVAAAMPYVPPSGDNYLWPIDLWVGEANTFLAAGYSPHFVAALALWLCSMLTLAVAYEKRSLLGAAGAGLIAAVLFQFHPYHAPVLYAIAAAWCVLDVIRTGGWRTSWPQLAAFIGVSMPTVAYHYGITHLDAAAVALTMTNRTFTPPLFYVLVGFGAISALWIPGMRSAARSRAIPPARLAMLAAWLIAQGLLLYAPLSFQRRFLVGLQFPLTVLTVPFLFDLHDRLKSGKRFGNVLAAAAGALAIVLMFLPSTIYMAALNIRASSDAADPLYFMDKTSERAALWFRRETPSDAVILSRLGTGNALVPFAGRRVYAGHWSATIGAEAKMREIARFYRDGGDAERSEFVRASGVTHVYVGPYERVLMGRPFGPAFERVFVDGDIEVYVLRRNGS